MIAPRRFSLGRITPGSRITGPAPRPGLVFVGGMSATRAMAATEVTEAMEVTEATVVMEFTEALAGTVTTTRRSRSAAPSPSAWP
jgi:hypothetical protein